MTQNIEARRTQAILQIRLDGAEVWDVQAFIAEKEAAGEDPWTIAEGAAPLTPEEIGVIIAQADQMIADASPGKPPEVARHLAMRRSLYARAVAAGEHSVAARILRDIADLEGIGPNAADDKNERKARLLLEIHARHQAIADAAEPDGQEWEQDFEHGPRFEPSSWFGVANDRERMAWKRTLDELAEDGLVTVTPASPRRVHVALTQAGEELVRRLAA